MNLKDTEFEWIFAYGSIVWRPGFSFISRELATLSGWQRNFTQASTDHRGTEEMPGRVVTLVETPGVVCRGIAYRIAPDTRAEIIQYLDERESGGYSRHLADIELANQQYVSALTYIAFPDNPNAREELPLPDLARLITERVGPSGANIDYVLNLAEELQSSGIVDPVVNDLANLLRQTGA